MKTKRILGLALVVGVLLSLCVPAFADQYLYRLASVDASNVYGATTKAGQKIEFDVMLYIWKLSDATTVTNNTYEVTEATGPEFNGTYYKNANLLKWSLVTGTDDSAAFSSITSITYQRTDIAGITPSTIVSTTDPYCIISSSEISSMSVNAGLKYKLHIVTTGTLANANTNVRIKAGLYSGNDDSEVSTYSSEATYTEKDGNDMNGSNGESITVSPDPEPSDGDGDDEDDRTPDDERNPENVATADYKPKHPYNGLDPVWTQTIDTTSGDYGKAKPALGKVNKSDLTLKAGSSKDIKVQLKGPIEELDVYIAVKDAIKLGLLEKNATDNIRLNRENLIKYNIPFRVVSYDLQSSVVGTDEKTIAKNWKAADKSFVTIQFNGGNFSYKGFPITISMSNTKTSSKPVAKAIKVNVEPLTSTPSWVHEVEVLKSSTDVEADAEAWWDTVKGQWYEVGKSHAVDTSGDIVTDDDNPVKISDWNVPTYTPDVAFQSSDTKWYMVPSMMKASDVPTKEEEPDTQEGGSLPRNRNVGEGTETGTDPTETTEETYVVNTELYIYEATHEEIVDRYDLYASEWATYDLKKDKPEAVTWVDPDGEEGEKSSYIDETFTVSGDAPCVITAKPGPADTAKLEKFFAAGYDLKIEQPKFDYLGNLKDNGAVYIYGAPKNTDKESKLAFTLTATNPSTKKKAALKVTAIAKTKPVFDKTTDNWISTKRVEAGKTPSVKFKAKGSKTITYKLGSWYMDGVGEEIEAEDEDYNEALAKALVAHKLSFDEKKGQIVLNSKTDKATLPTLNSAGDAFESLDIVVTAYNNVGATQAWASVAITGAKPKLNTKALSLAANTSELTLKADVGTAKPAGASTAGANVRYIPDEDGAKQLADLGLKLLHWDNYTVVVDSTDFYAADTKLPDDWEANLSGDKETVTTVKVTYISADETIANYEETKKLSGDVTTKKEDDNSITATVGTGGVYYQDESGSITWAYAGDDGTYLKNGKTYEVASADASIKNTAILRVVDKAALKSAADENGKKDLKYKVNMTLENFGATNKGAVTITVPMAVAAMDVGALPGNVKAVYTAPDSKAGTSANNGTSRKAGGTYADANAEAEAEAEEAEPVVFGAPRTAADLTAGQRAFLAGKGLKVIAVLPEVTAAEDGQFDIEADLDEEAPEGAELIYVPFPKDVPEVEDDSIVDFYDEAGAPVEGVPASHKIIASPWLRSGVTYAPVIAIEADAE